MGWGGFSKHDIKAENIKEKAEFYYQIKGKHLAMSKPIMNKIEQQLVHSRIEYICYVCMKIPSSMILQFENILHMETGPSTQKEMINTPTG